MKYSTFERLYNEIILPSADSLISSYATQKIRLELNDGCQKPIFENYIMLCAHMRKHYMGEKENSNQKPTANRHKVAACFAVAVIMAHPITFLETKNEEDRKVHIANEYLGLMTGLGIVNSMLKEANSTWREADGFDVPQYENDRKPFLDDVAVGLHNSIRSLSIDLMSLANVFTMIEEYTILKRKQESAF